MENYPALVEDPVAKVSFWSSLANRRVIVAPPVIGFIGAALAHYVGNSTTVWLGFIASVFVGVTVGGLLPPEPDPAPSSASIGSHVVAGTGASLLFALMLEQLGPNALAIASIAIAGIMALLFARGLKAMIRRWRGLPPPHPRVHPEKPRLTTVMLRRLGRRTGGHSR